MSARTEWEVQVSEALTDLAAASTAHALYGGAHPRFKAVLDRFHRKLTALVSQQNLEIVVVGEELFVNERAFTRLARQAAALLRRLRRHRAGYLRIVAGVEQEELAVLIAALASNDDTPLATTDHITVGQVTLADTSELGGPDDDAGGEGGRHLPTARDRVTVIAQVFENFVRGRPLATAELEHVVGGILRALADRPHPAPHLAGWQGESRFLAVHCHNTAVMATGLARLAGVPRASAAELGLAAVLHDIGKVFLAEEYFAGEEALPIGEELELILDHPQDGFRLLLPLTHLPPLVPVVALEHHLHHRGTGFPRLSQPRRPHPAARLVSACDALDTLLTRFASRALTTREGALAWLESHAGTILDPHWVDALVHLFASTTPPPATPSGT